MSHLNDGAPHLNPAYMRKLTPTPFLIFVVAIIGRTMKKITVTPHLTLASLVAALIWSWVFTLIALWVNGAVAEFFESLFLSLYTVKKGLYAFPWVLIVSVVSYYSVLRGRELLTQLLGWSLIALAMSAVYLFYHWWISQVQPGWIHRFYFIYMASGLLAGFSFWSVMMLPISDATAYESADRDEAQGLDRWRRRISILIPSLVGFAGLGVSSIPIIRTILKSKEYIDVDVSKLTDNQLLTVDVSGRPVWILKRTDEAVRRLGDNTERLLDPDSNDSIQPQSTRNAHRSIDERYFVAYGICTHLGCSPMYKQDKQLDFGAEIGTVDGPVFFCPCHSAVFDAAGRVYKNTPAPLNLAIPDYEVLADSIIRLHNPSLKRQWQIS